MNITHRLSPILVMIFLVLASLACGGTSAIPPTLDPNAIQTVIEQTLVALATLTTTTYTPLPTNISTPTGTPTTVVTETPKPTETHAITPTPRPTYTPKPIFQLVHGASCIPTNPIQTGKVVDVVDGDTIKVLMDQDGQTYTVRYIGMDTPEYTTQLEYFGSEAAVKNVQLVMGENVSLIKDVSETDRYGRLLRYVIANNLFVNYELVASGFANTASFPPDIACIPTFQEAEQAARTGSLGLWNAPPTLAPRPTLAPVTGGSGGGNAPCNCGGSDLDCGDFSSHSSAQACYQYCVSQGYGDVFRLDGDDDGSACDSLP